MTPIKAIRAKCLDCSANQIVEVRECHIKNCSLWPYRMGKRPDVEGKPKRVLSPERRAALAVALQKYRAKVTKEGEVI